MFKKGRKLKGCRSRWPGALSTLSTAATFLCSIKWTGCSLRVSTCEHLLSARLLTESSGNLKSLKPPFFSPPSFR